MKSTADFLPVLFFHQGSCEDGASFFGDLWPEARVVADQSGGFFEAFGVKTGNLRELLGPGVWVRAIKAVRKGHRLGKPVGDPWTMPGIFLVENREILWSWRFKHAGDLPDFSRISRDLKKATQRHES